MEPGLIVEYIDKQKIYLSVVTEVKNQRLRLLNETNREMNISLGRLTLKGKMRLDMKIGRDHLVSALRDIAERRNRLSENINIEELWEVLNSEQEWIDIATMAAFCFEEELTDDHLSAVGRAFFKDRLYFKFNPDRFFPNTVLQVEAFKEQAREEERKKHLVVEGINWLKSVLSETHPDPEVYTKSPSQRSIIRILKSYYLFGKDSEYGNEAKDMVAKAGVTGNEAIFEALVKIGVWKEHENIELHLSEIPVDFKDDIINSAAYLVNTTETFPDMDKREDLTDLPLLTIDGQTTLDFDDALSVEIRDDHILVGVHIADVACLIKQGDTIDKEAMNRASSIYMPDQKISMLPPSLAEGLLSLKQALLRPAVSIMIKLSTNADILDYRIVPSMIRIHRQLTYSDVTGICDSDKEISTLHNLSMKFRNKRLSDGAIQITLPEINVWVKNGGEITVNKVTRESPGRVLVSEAMIMANYLMADYLKKNDMPAVYRSQPKPRERLFKGNEGSLFQNWMQRRHLSRLVLGADPEPHSGLGLEVYVTATSPIRKYYDLLTQRQIRAVIGLDTPYSKEDMEKCIIYLKEPMSKIGSIQFRRQKYWLMKYLETRIGDKTEAIVLEKKKNIYQILLTDYLIECFLPYSPGLELKPEDIIQVTIQHINAKKDIITVFMG